MEIIEKQVEKVKEVPTDGYYGYGRRDVNGKANAGLTLGIIGTALGAWALFGNNRGSSGLQKFLTLLKVGLKLLQKEKSCYKDN